MVTVDLEAVLEVSAMGEVSMVSGVEVHGVAAETSRFFLKIAEECRPEPGTMRRRYGNQVIDVEDVTPRHRVKETIAGSRNDSIAFNDVDDAVSLTALGAPAFDELLRRSKMGPELFERRPTLADVVFVLGDLNLPVLRSSRCSSRWQISFIALLYPLWRIRVNASGPGSISRSSGGGSPTNAGGAV
jgi:hypothetical protein